MLILKLLLLVTTPVAVLSVVYIAALIEQRHIDRKVRSFKCTR